MESHKHIGQSKYVVPGKNCGVHRRWWLACSKVFARRLAYSGFMSNRKANLILELFKGAQLTTLPSIRAVSVDSEIPMFTKTDTPFSWFRLRTDQVSVCDHSSLGVNNRPDITATASVPLPLLSYLPQIAPDPLPENQSPPHNPVPHSEKAHLCM